MEELDYMAIDKDSKFVAVASPEMPQKDLAKELVKWVRWGCSIERCSDEFVRQYFGKIINQDDRQKYVMREVKDVQKR